MTGAASRTGGWRISVLLVLLSLSGGVVTTYVAGILMALGAGDADRRSLVIGRGGQRVFVAARQIGGEFTYLRTSEVEPWDEASAFSFATEGPNLRWRQRAAAGMSEELAIGDPQGHLLLQHDVQGGGARIVGFGGQGRDPLGPMLQFVKPMMEVRYVVRAGWPIPYLEGEAMGVSVDGEEVLQFVWHPASLPSTAGVHRLTRAAGERTSETRLIPLRPIAGPFLGAAVLHGLVLLGVLGALRAGWTRWRGARRGSVEAARG